MKDKQMIVLVDDEFLEKVEYLRKINDFKNKSDTVRKTIEKEYAKNVECDVRFFEFLVNKMNPNELEKYRVMYESKNIKVEGEGRWDGEKIKQQRSRLILSEML